MSWDESNLGDSPPLSAAPHLELQPFELSSALDANGTQFVFVQGLMKYANLYDNSNLIQTVNQEVVQINGRPALDVLEDFGGKYGQSRGTIIII